MSFGSFDSFDPLCFYVFDILLFLIHGVCLFAIWSIWLIPNPKGQSNAVAKGRQLSVGPCASPEGSWNWSLYSLWSFFHFLNFFKNLKRLKDLKRFNGLHVFYFLFFPGGSVGLWDITPFISSWISWYLAKISIVYKV